VIHYHGTPLTPRAKLYEMAGKHFCVSFADPRDADVCLKIGQSVLWDNGAFSAYTRRVALVWRDYYEWLEPRLHHPHFAVAPDVIDGSEEQQDRLLSEWPHPRELSAPVWHMAEPIERLLRLCQVWPKVCFGSSGEYWQVGSEKWERRADEAFNALVKRHTILPWVHMMRGLSLSDGRWPFASADSVNVARNYKSNGREPEIMAREIDGVQPNGGWVIRPEQISLVSGRS